MVSVTDFFNDNEHFEAAVSANEELDLEFLEVVDHAESLFAISDTYFESLQVLSPRPAFVPTLHTSVFDEPLAHAVWCAPWPTPERHFPA